jgi:hypothetical protein
MDYAMGKECKGLGNIHDTELFRWNEDQHLTSLKRHLINARESRYAENIEKTCRSYYR